MFEFGQPLWLLLLILPFLILLARRWYGGQPALTVSGLDAAKSATTLASRLAGMLPLLKYMAMALLIVALAGPRLGEGEVVERAEGVDIVLAVDLSESMAALDFKTDEGAVTRLEAVKEVVSEFIADRRGDRIGLVVFGSEAYTQMPLTRDYEALRRVLGQLEIGAAGSHTAIGDALGIGLKRLLESEAESRVMILLTDGQSNIGDISPDEAVAALEASGVRVYTIGAGTHGNAPYRVDDPLFGERVIYRKADIDEQILEMIARRTGGLYFRATDTDGLRRIYDQIDELEKTEIETVIHAEYEPLYPWLLGGALALLLLFATLVNTRFLRVP
jgi:Ca-activated chloride channel family protein